MSASPVVVPAPADAAGARSNLALLCRRLHEHRASGTLTIAFGGGSGGITWNTGEIGGVTWCGEIGLPAFLALVEQAEQRAVEWSFQPGTHLHAHLQPLPPMSLLLDAVTNVSVRSKRLAGPASASLWKATEVEVMSLAAKMASAYLRKEWQARPPRSVHEIQGVVARTLRTLRLPQRAVKVVLSRIARRARRARGYEHADQGSAP